MTKVQLTLTDEEAGLLIGYGSQLGYSLPKMAKFFISKASEEIFRHGILPVYQMSEKTERAGLKALEERRAGKAIEVEDLEGFFTNL